jgi:hypothetical protein
MHPIKLHDLDFDSYPKDDGYRYTFANVGGLPEPQYSIPNISRRGWLFEPAVVSVPTLGPWRSITEKFGHDGLQFATRTVDMLLKQSNLRFPRVTAYAPASDVDDLDHQSQLACDET